MKRLGIDAGLAQLVGNHFGGMFGRHKHQHPAPAVLRHQVAQELGAPAGVHGDGALHDIGQVLWLGLNLDAHRVAQQRLGQRLHRRGKGGREKQVLALLGQQSQNAGQLFGKAQVQQAVGFIQHQGLDLGQGNGVVVHQVQQAPGGGHHNVRAAPQSEHLRIDGHAAKHDGHLQGARQVLRQAAKRLPDLRGQFPGGHQHQQGRTAQALKRRVLQGLQQRQRKGAGLA